MVQREGPDLLLMEKLRDATYVRFVYRALVRQGERFDHVIEESLVRARTRKGLSAGSLIAGNH